MQLKKLFEPVLNILKSFFFRVYNKSREGTAAVASWLDQFKQSFTGIAFQTVVHGIPFLFASANRRLRVIGLIVLLILFMLTVNDTRTQLIRYITSDESNVESSRIDRHGVGKEAVVCLAIPAMHFAKEWAKIAEDPPKTKMRRLHDNLMMLIAV